MRPLSASQREALEEAVSNYEGQLTVDAARYLTARGIDRETAVTFRVGSVVDPLPGHARYQGWLSIPYLIRGNAPVSLRFRCIEAHDHRELGHGKYLSMPGEPARVFNVGAIPRADAEIHVTEGEFDALVLERLGLPAIAIPGASLWRGHHRRMLAGFNRVWVWGDPDEAGAELVNKICRALPNARGVRLTEGDVTETFLAGGADALLALITQEAK